MVNAKGTPNLSAKWEQFRLIVMERGTTISELLAEIDRKHRLLPYPNAHPRVLALSAALSITVVIFV
jgi:predicted DNA-binding ribbon-helix-helix protein